MSHKSELRKQREGTVINATSSKQEKQLSKAVNAVIQSLEEKFPTIKIELVQSIRLEYIIDDLKKKFPDISFANTLPSSSMKPDGGLLYIIDKSGNKFPILITEKKNQGTNDLRLQEGQKKQAKGNAIERLGKNVIGLRTAMLSESIFPFICFGDGCDFEEDSSILDRVITIAMFGELNKKHLFNKESFNRGSFYFRATQWTEQEMFDICVDIATRSVYYYFGKYGETTFI